MVDRPIIFSGPMVRALLEGRKTQTRRIIKPQPDQECVPPPGWPPVRIAVGDSLWVRENWRPVHSGDPSRGARYMADLSGPDQTKWKPSIHMPRWASRLTLVVTGVKVERLQDISEEDAIAEGIEDVTGEVASSDKSLRFWKRYRDGGWNSYVDSPIGSYASLWTEINGPGSWEANPWVVAVSFTIHRCNIDQMEAIAI